MTPAFIEKELNQQKEIFDRQEKFGKPLKRDEAGHNSNKLNKDWI